MSSVEFHVDSASVTRTTRALTEVGEQMQTEGRAELRQLGMLVEHDAEHLALARIPTVTVPWSQMRTGVAPSVVYVVPQNESTHDPRRKRPKFGALLMSRALVPALERRAPEVLRRYQALAERVCEKANRG